MALVNGHEQNYISIADRGLAYGDGLFETIAWTGKYLHLWARHWHRLKEGAQRLQIKLPDEQQVLTQIKTLIAAQNRSQASYQMARVVKLILSRGSGGRGYRLPDSPEPQLIITLHPWPEREDSDYQQGIRVRVCHTMLSAQPVLAGLKHLNRLEQVMAASELTDTCYMEGLMLEFSTADHLQRQTVIEGISSNVFFVREGQLHTPEIRHSGVNGTIRCELLEYAKKRGIQVQTGVYSLQDMMDAEEVFFSNSIFGILPVRQIDYPDYTSHCIPNNIQSVSKYYNQRKLSTLLAQNINQVLQRPCQFNEL